MKDRYGRAIVKLSEPMLIGKKTENTYRLSVRFEGSVDREDFDSYQRDLDLYRYVSASLFQQISNWVRWSECK